MRWAALADIHGNLPALEAVLADARAQGAAGFWLAGDLLPRAPFVQETLALLRELPGQMIRGNVDTYQVDFAANPGGGGFPGLQNGIVRWTQRRLGADGLAFLRALPEEYAFAPDGLGLVRLVHATPGQPRRGLVPDQDPGALETFRQAGLWDEQPVPPLGEQVGAGPERLVVSGHTHIAWSQRVGARLVLNPGAVGMTSDGDPRARYALVEWGRDGWQVQPRAVAYDLAALERAYFASGMLEECGVFAYVFLASALTGLNIAWFFIRAGLELQRERPRGDALWAELARVFPWETYGVAPPRLPEGGE